MSAGTTSLTLTLGGREVPAVRVTGARPGPELRVVAGVHGCEVSAIAGLRAFVRELDPATLAGTVLGVPVVNLSAFWTRTPFVVPGDGKNLNRCFPGDEHGSEAERLAHDITTQLIEGADAFVDMHAGDQVEALEPFALFDTGPADELARDLAAAYGVGYVIRQATGPDRAVSGSSSMAAAALGVPAIIAEAGGCGLVAADAVQTHRQGLRGVLGRLGMLDGVEAPGRPVELDRFLWLSSAQAGWWEPAVQAGAHVLAGDVLGTVSSLDGGELLEHILAPASGVLMFVTTSPAVQAAGLLLGLGAASTSGWGTTT